MHYNAFLIFVSWNNHGNTDICWDICLRDLWFRECWENTGKLSKPELVVKALHNFWEFSLLFDEAM